MCRQQERVVLLLLPDQEALAQEMWKAEAAKSSWIIASLPSNDDALLMTIIDDEHKMCSASLQRPALKSSESESPRRSGLRSERHGGCCRMLILEQN